MNEMTNISNILSELKEKGYEEEFELIDNNLVCNGNLIKIPPKDINVDSVYHIEGPSNLGDEAILYAITSSDRKVKGTFLHDFSKKKNLMSDEMIFALKDSYTGDEITIKKEEGDDTSSREKSNLATELRPEGSRKLNAELIELDFNVSIKQIREEQTYKEGDRNAITLFKSKSMRVILIALHAGAEMKTHTAPGNISVQVLEGEILFKTSKKTSHLEERQMITLQSDIPHSVTAKTAAVLLLTMAIIPAAN